VTDAVPAARTCNGIQHIPFPAVTDHNGGDWLRRISPGQAIAITDFLPSTRRLRRKGPFSGQEISGRFHRKRIAISINLLRFRAAESRSPVARSV
jgi:hypothetical protein